MNLLQPHFIAGLALALLPIILHLVKKQRAKKVILGSLWLLHRKRHNLPRKLKLTQIILLATRVALALALAIYFLKPVLPKSPSWLSKLLPLEQKITVYLDTHFDSKSDLMDFYLKDAQIGTAESIQFLELSQASLNRNGILATVRDTRVNAKHTEWLVSRFYGVTKEDISSLKAEGLNLLPFGPDRIQVSRFRELSIEPDSPFPDEKISIHGSIESNVTTSLNLELWQGANLSRQVPLTVTAGVAVPFSLEEGINISANATVELRLGPNNIQSIVLPLKPRTQMRIGLMDDRAAPNTRPSRLYAIHEFIQSLISLYETKAPILIQHINSKDLAKLDKKFDFVIVGDMDQATRIPADLPALIFFQKTPSVQQSINEAMELTTWDLRKESVNVQFLPLHTMDRSLLDRMFKADNTLQFKAPQLQVLALAGQEPLIVRKGLHVFSGINFTNNEFDGLRHPYFPVLLYRILLNRIEEKTVVLSGNQNLLQRLIPLPEITDSKVSTITEQSDLSLVFLIFVLLFSIIELGLVLSLQKIRP